MRTSLHTLIYSTVLGIVCALLLTGAAEVTEPYRQSNADAEKMRNILSVLDVPFDSKASSQELVKVFEANVRTEQLGELTTYTYFGSESESAGQAVAIPLAGPGLWGPIKGFLALESDMATIRGISFHEQEETPGLGGEINSQWFRDQFKGKSITDAAGNPGLHIVRGGGSGPNEVDAITGATMTCEKVEIMLNAAIEQIIEERSKHGR